MYDLYVAIERDDINEVKRLINKDKSLLNTKIHHGSTPILIASLKERHSIVKYLLEEGCCFFLWIAQHFQLFTTFFRICFVNIDIHVLYEMVLALVMFNA